MNFIEAALLGLSQFFLSAADRDAKRAQEAKALKPNPAQKITPPKK
jgi:hypothetical protein